MNAKNPMDRKQGSFYGKLELQGNLNRKGIDVISRKHKAKGLGESDTHKKYRGKKAWRIG